MIEFVDTHTHLFTSEFDEDRDAAVGRASDAGVVSLCLPSITENSLTDILKMCDSYPSRCYPMLGLHPTELGRDYLDVLGRLHDVLKSNDRFIAVGEVGLDFYWDETYRSEQLHAFNIQIEWASEFSLPLAIHSRSAFEELYATMEEHRSKSLSGVFHCFSGNEEQARSLLSFEGFYIGVGGAVTYKKSDLPQVLRAAVPLERLVLETDSPYLAPVPRRGRRNESSYIPYIADFLALVYGCSVEEIARVTTENARRLFPKIAPECQ